MNSNDLSAEQQDDQLESQIVPEDLLDEGNSQKLLDQDALKKISEYEEVIRRQQAEFENFRKRTEREKIEFSDYALFAIIKDLLSIKDSFDMALSQSTVGQNVSMEDFLSGFKLVSDQLQTVFQKYDVSLIPGEGSPFDPTFHQALRFEENVDVSTETVGQVYQKGYLFKKKLLREASVCVLKPAAKLDVSDDTVAQ